MGLVSPHKSLTELYSELLIRQRWIVRHQEDGTAMCAWCNGQKSGHLPDDRCSIAVTSQYFTNVRNDELNRIGKAITLIEELQEL